MGNVQDLQVQVVQKHSHSGSPLDCFQLDDFSKNSKSLVISTWT